MYTQIELPTTAFQAVNQNIEEMFNHFYSISDQYPNGYTAGKVDNNNLQRTSVQNDSSLQEQLIMEHNALELIISALRAGNDRFGKLAQFLLDDSFLYEAERNRLKECATNNYPIWCQIKWGWAVASAIKVIMQDVRDLLLDADCKLYIIKPEQTYDYKNCFVSFSDTDQLYYINNDRELFPRNKALIKLDELKEISPSVFKLPKELVSLFLEDDELDNFSLLNTLDNDSIPMYHAVLLNRLTDLQPVLDKNFNYLMDQVLSTEDKDSRQPLYAKFLTQIRCYMPTNLEEMAQSIFNINEQNPKQALLATLDTLIASSSKAENGAQITYEIHTTPYVDGMQNLSDRKKGNRTHEARLLMQERFNGVAGHEIPSQYRPLTAHQKTILEQSPNQKTTAGIPTSYTPLTEKQLIALGGSVAHDAIDPKTGSPLYLLALLYDNTNVCNFLKLHGGVLQLETKNLIDNCAPTKKSG